MEPTQCLYCQTPFKPRHSKHKVCSGEACKKQQKNYLNQAFYEKNPGYKRESSARWRARNPGRKNWPLRDATLAGVREYKEANPCTDCNGYFHFSAMDFDHVSGEKILGVGTMASWGYSPEKVWAEIAKCDLVCSNCHRVRTFNRQQPLGGNNV